MRLLLALSVSWHISLSFATLISSANFTVPGAFPASAFSKYYNEPTGTSAQAQPVVSDPVTVACSHLCPFYALTANNKKSIIHTNFLWPTRTPSHKITQTLTLCLPELLLLGCLTKLWYKSNPSSRIQSSEVVHVLSAKPCWRSWSSFRLQRLSEGQI